MSEVKPREFWIEEWNDGNWHSSTCWKFKPRVDSIRVIEYSAYEKLNADAFEDTKKLYAQAEEIEKLKAENERLKKSVEYQMEKYKQLDTKPSDLSVIESLTESCQKKNDKITKLTRQLNTLKKVAEQAMRQWKMYVCDLNFDDLEELLKDEGNLEAHEYAKCKKALQDVEESENE